MRDGDVADTCEGGLENEIERRCLEREVEGDRPAERLPENETLAPGQRRERLGLKALAKLGRVLRMRTAV